VARSSTISFVWRRRPAGRLTGPLRRLGLEALDRLGIDGAEVGVLLTDDAAVRILNRRWRGKDSPTDVLSFPSGDRLPDGGIYLGDVAISLDTAGRQALEGGRPLLAELQALLLHAILHLCGHDHETDSGEMAALEARLARELGQ
jgi:probable rRNA maturation factor